MYRTSAKGRGRCGIVAEREAVRFRGVPRVGVARDRALQGILARGFAAGRAGECSRGPDPVRRADSSRGLGQPRLLPFSVGLALDDEFVGSVLEAVDGALSPEGVGHGREPLLRLAVRGD